MEQRVEAIFEAQLAHLQLSQRDCDRLDKLEEEVKMISTIQTLHLEGSMTDQKSLKIVIDKLKKLEELLEKIDKALEDSGPKES